MRKKVLLVVLSLICTMLFAISVSAASSKLGTSVVVESKSYAVGDISKDGQITARDALLILKYTAKLETFTSEYIKLMDVDGNGYATVSDARDILMYLTGMSDRETVLNYYQEVYTVKFMDEVVAEKKMTTISSVDSYNKYIDACLAEYPDAFGDMAEEVRSEYDSSYFKNGRYLVAACINNDKSDSVAPVFKGVFKEGQKSELDVYSYISLEEQNGTSSWCMFIECSKYNNYVYYPDCEINYEKECELSISEHTIGPVKCEKSAYKGKEIRTIDTLDEYNHYIEVCGKAEELGGLYDEAYFEGNELIAVCKPLSAGSYEVALEKMTLNGNSFTLYMHSIKPVTESEEMEHWLMLIPVAGKQWEDMDYAVESAEILVEGVASDSDSAVAVSKELRYANYSELSGIRVISTYEDYVSYIIKENKYNPKISVTGCTREFFEENSLIVVDDYTTSGMFELEYDSIEECEGETLIHINHYSPSDAATDDGGDWRITIPVAGKDWEDKTLRRVYTFSWLDDVENLESNKYFKINSFKIGTADDSAEGVTVLYSYDEFKAYVDAIVEENPDAFGGDASSVKASYSDADFVKNAIVAINVVETDPIINVPKIVNIVYSEKTFDYKLKITLPTEPENDGVRWCVFALLESRFVEGGHTVGIIKEYVSHPEEY